MKTAVSLSNIGEKKLLAVGNSFTKTFKLTWILKYLFWQFNLEDFCTCSAIHKSSAKWLSQLANYIRFKLIFSH